MRLLLLVVVALSFSTSESAEAGRQRRAQKSSKGQRTAVRARAKKSALSNSAKGAPKGQWLKRRNFKQNDSGLKDHAERHSGTSAKEYLAKGQKNISQGLMIKGSKFKDARYYFRKIGKDAYSVTITNKRGQIKTIDPWKQGDKALTREAIEKGMKSSGLARPKNFWKKL